MRAKDFDRLYTEHAQPLLAFLVYRTGDPVLAEDLLADSFERVLRARRQFNPSKGSEKTWIYTIALNCLRDHGRRRAAEGRALARIGDSARADEPRVPSEVVDERAELMRALEHLAVEERETIALRYGADLTVPEIARLTKKRVTTVEGRVYRALRKLRDQLDSHSELRDIS